jgi:Family of unknown function (DUF6518)
VTNDQVAPTPTPPHSWLRAGITLVVVVATSLVLGGLTSFAQGILPDALRPFANSASGWTVLTAFVVWRVGARTRPSAVLGLASFVALVLGYTIASELRGLTYSPLLFGLIGTIAGPFVGVAASWLRRTGWRAALGSGLLAGIALGECLYGLIVVSGTTGWIYWALIGVAGAALLATTLMKRVEPRAPAILGVGITLAIAGAFFLAYSTVGAVGITS